MITERAGRGILGLLLLGALALAVRFDRRTWPALVGDEATYLMAAESLAFDFDLRYAPDELTRFERHWGRAPDGLILQSGDGGRTLLYAKPALYPLAIAPFVRVSPTRGPFVANALFLAAAAVALVWALRPALAHAAPWWTAALLFASSIPAYVLWAHADLLLLSLSTLGLALAWGPIPAEPTGGEGTHWARWGRWLTAGLLLALVGASRWWYLGLVIAGAAGLPRRRRRALFAYGAGALLALSLQVGSDLVGRGVWTSYGGQRVSFDQTTGFPSAGADSADDWQQRVERAGPGSWIAEGRRFPFPVTARLLAWDLLYFLVGPHVGLLTWAPALLLLLLAGRLDRPRLVLLAAFALTVAGFLLMRPFNFYGGGGAIGNRYILPVLPALWFLIAAPSAARRRPFSPVAAPLVALLGAPLLLPLWTAPTTFPFPPGENYPWVSTTARRFLPYETTQSHLKPSGGEDFVHAGLWVKPLGTGLRRETDPQGREWLLVSRATAQDAGLDLIVGSPRALPALCTETSLDTASRAGVLRRGRPAGPGAGPPPGPGDPVHGPRQRLALGWPTARHPMWWTPDDWFLYRVRVQAEGPTGVAPAGPARIRFLTDCPEAE